MARNATLDALRQLPQAALDLLAQRLQWLTTERERTFLEGYEAGRESVLQELATTPKPIQFRGISADEVEASVQRWRDALVNQFAEPDLKLLPRNPRLTDE